MCGVLCHVGLTRRSTGPLHLLAQSKLRKSNSKAKVMEKDHIMEEAHI